MGQSIYNRNRTRWRLAWGLTVLGALCLGPSLAAAQADLNEDLVHCEAPQGPESLDNGSSRCTATAADTGHAESTASKQSTAAATAFSEDSRAKSTATK